MAIGRNKILTPWHDKKGNLKFPYRALHSKVFLWPVPPKSTFGEESVIEIPEIWKNKYRDGTGIVLSVGKGYWGKDKKYHSTPTELKPGIRVFYDKTVPHKIPILGLDGKEYLVVFCLVVDILGVCENE